MKYFIYKIVNKYNLNDFYIGSTKDLNSRISKHKTDCKYPRYKLHSYISENGGFNNFYVYIIEIVECEIGQQFIIEDKYITELNPPLNMCKAYGGSKEEYKKQYYECNKEKNKEAYKANKKQIREQQKQYKEANKEKIKEYRQANAEKIKEQEKRYRQANAEKIKEQQRKRYNEKKRQLN